MFTPQDVELSEGIQEEADDDEAEHRAKDAHAADCGQVAKEELLLHPQPAVEDDRRQEIPFRKQRITGLNEISNGPKLHGDGFYKGCGMEVRGINLERMGSKIMDQLLSSQGVAGPPWTNGWVHRCSITPSKPRLHEEDGRVKRGHVPHPQGSVREVALKDQQEGPRGQPHEGGQAALGQVAPNPVREVPNDDLISRHAALQITHRFHMVAHRGHMGYPMED